MADLFDYIRWRGDLTFTQDPPNEVDALIFSGLSYIRYGGTLAANPDARVPLRQAAEEFFALEDHEERILLKKDLDLIHEAARSRRFGDVKLFAYRDIRREEEELQFAAVTFLLDDGTAFLAFRGTDSSLVGWKEDFNMSFMQAVPAQLMALEYVRQMDAELWMPLRLGGHSKGGNLSVFAAARSSPSVQSRILQVFNNDGPGFNDYLMGDIGYETMVPKIRTFVPQSSVIGMLLEHEEPYTIIRSKQVSLLQHDYYTWEVMGRNFLTMEEITADSRFVSATLKNWLAEMTPAERSEIVEAMFGLLELGEVDSALDIFHPRNIKTYIKTLSADGALRRLLSEEFQNLLEAARKTQAQFSQEKKLLEDGQEN
ncbi:MAG: DUF2974 domain-containing protein [Oscillospiraceae bacterium]|nr:DUF2974 domain-containing protein [Oscillospiraceae bacterium]